MGRWILVETENTWILVETENTCRVNGRGWILGGFILSWPILTHEILAIPFTEGTSVWYTVLPRIVVFFIATVVILGRTSMRDTEKAIIFGNLCTNSIAVLYKWRIDMLNAEQHCSCMVQYHEHILWKLACKVFYTLACKINSFIALC